MPQQKVPLVREVAIDRSRPALLSARLLPPAHVPHHTLARPLVSKDALLYHRLKARFGKLLHRLRLACGSRANLPSPPLRRLWGATPCSRVPSRALKISLRACGFPRATEVALSRAPVLPPPSSQVIRQLDSLRSLHPVVSDWAPLWNPEAPPSVRGPAALALADRHPAGCWPVSELQLFTDGSFQGPGRLGWAVTVFEKCSDGICERRNFLGSFCGNLDAWVARGLCTADDNIDAETVAFCVASLWALSCPDWLPVSVWTDCHSVLQVAAGSADSHRPGHTSRLLGRCRHVWQVLGRRPYPPQAFWIPGHAGMPPNELADHIAKQACFAKDLPAMPAKLFEFLLHPLLG